MKPDFSGKQDGLHRMLTFQYKNPCLHVGAERVCLESTRESGMNAVQKMEDLVR